jgi:aminodeoxyfutalosine synthase
MADMEINTAIASRAREGARLTEAELVELDGADVLSLGMLADEVRRARVGDTVSYARVLEVGPHGLPTLEASEAAVGRAHEIRLTTPATSLAETAAQIAAVRARVGPAKRLVAFSLADILAREWGGLAEVLTRLAGAGLDALVEAPIDLVSVDDVEAAVGCGVAPSTLSVRRQPGAERVALLVKARAVIDRVPSLRSVSPLSREQSVTVPTTGYHDVRMVALARLALPEVPTIAVDWHQYGPKLAQVALMFGANHLDRVSVVDDDTLGPRRAVLEDVRRNITAAGFTPAEPGEAA